MRKVVAEVQCSRCDRTENLEYVALEGTQPPAFEAQLPQLHGVVVVRFDDLCAPCQRSVKALLEQIGKRVKGMSPDRAAKEKKVSPSVAKKPDPTPPPASSPRSQPVPSTASRGSRAS